MVAKSIKITYNIMVNRTASALTGGLTHTGEF